MRVYTTVEQARHLPRYHHETIPEDYLDAMGHMNVRYYMAVFDNGGWKMLEAVGMDEAYYRENRAGGFGLRHFISYINEVHVGERVAVHSRLLGCSDTRIHFLHFMVNETRHTIAATLEGVGAHADLLARKITPYPPAVLQKIKALVREHQALDWDAPTCGILGV